MPLSYALLLFSLLFSTTKIATATTIFSSSYRKDAWLADYIEFGVPEPLDGGRLHIIGQALFSGIPTSVFLNGTYVNMSATEPNPSSWSVDWARVEPLNGLVAGQSFWVSFHSRSTTYDTARTSGALTSLLVLDKTGNTLINGSFAVTVPQVTVSWVTTTANASTVLMYMRNTANTSSTTTSSNSTLVSALLNGVDITSLLPAVSRTIPAGQMVMWPLSVSSIIPQVNVAPGQVWNLDATWSDSTTSAAGGIFFPEFYPRETWFHSSDCPFPTMNDTAYALHRSHGIDTFFTEFKQDASCHTSLNSADIVNVLAPQYDFYVLPSAEDGRLLPLINDTSHLAGIFLADEDDTIVDEKARNLLASVITARTAFPHIPTYAGGASNRYTGAYSGITDIKGLDAYIGACAPHYALLAMPARGSYDYLANTRANHAPGPTWLYTQGFEDGWDSKLTGNRQANAAEIAIQVLSVPAAGAKGLMIFETQLSYAQGISAPAFATLGTLLHEIGAMRELYRAGDATGMIDPLAGGGNASASSILAEATLSPRAMIVHLLNTQAVNDTYNDICCALDLSACHFTFVPVSLDGVAITIPAGFTIEDSFEVFNASVVNGVVPISGNGGNGNGGEVSLPSLTLGIEGPGSSPYITADISIVRTFVLAFDTQLRGDIVAALAGNDISHMKPVPAVFITTTATALGGPPTPDFSFLSAPKSSTNVSWWRSARDTNETLTPQPALTISTTSPACVVSPLGDNSTLVVTVNTSQTYQQIWGFGGAVTESAISVFQKLAPQDQEIFLSWLYGEEEETTSSTSLHYTAGRLTIGSCDFALNYYNYAETPFDLNMTNFSIAHDEEAIIPFLLRAQAAAVANGRALEYIAAPWSPPAWMKSNYPLNNYTITAMSCFPLGPLDCALLPQYQPAYALYLSKYLTAYANAGVSRIAHLSVQNEPQAQTGTITYEGLWMDPPAMLEFVAEYLGPQLKADGHLNTTSIAIFDHNQADAVLYASPILADPVASSYVGMVAYHWYSGPDWSALEELHALFPQVPQLATEATAGRGTSLGWYKTPDWTTGEYYGRFILRDLGSWSTGFIDWNILLDANGGPDHGDPTGEECEGLIQCGSDAMIIADTTVNPPVLYRQSFYWYMAAVSRFVPRGSVRVGLELEVGGGLSPVGDDGDALAGAAFVTPSGDTVLVLMNAGNATVSLCVDAGQTVGVFGGGGGGNTPVSLLPHSIQTFVW